jgi:Domain of unknown function (DUF4397)
MRRSVIAAGVTALIAGLATAVFVPTSGATQPVTGSVRVVHALRGVVADVYLDGQLILETFEPERTTDPVDLPAGAHQVDVRLAGSPADSPPAVSGTLDVQGGAAVSAVVHLSAAAAPTMSVFPDEDQGVPAGQTRVVVRHVAAAPAIDVRLNQQEVATNVVNTGEAEAEVTPATYELSVTNTGTPDVLAPPQEVPLPEGTANTMYLIGDQATSTLAWIAVQQTGLQTPPAGVATGNSGLAADDGGGSGRSGAIVAALLAGVGMLMIAGRRLSRR